MSPMSGWEGMGIQNVFCTGRSNIRPALDGDWKYHVNRRDGDELYDLVNDPNETNERHCQAPRKGGQYAQVHHGLGRIAASVAATGSTRLNGRHWVRWNALRRKPRSRTLQVTRSVSEGKTMLSNPSKRVPVTQRSNPRTRRRLQPRNQSRQHPFLTPGRTTADLCNKTGSNCTTG